MSSLSIPSGLKMVRWISTASLLRKSNLVLMGPPGAGKTSVGREISKVLQMPVYDVDNDHLENEWGTSVAQKLADLGDEEFIKAEGAAAMNIRKKGHIISLTGSNPLHPESIEYLSKDGLVVFLDVPKEDILKRMEEMKVDRIVGQASADLGSILDHRSAKYESRYDARVLVERESSVRKISEQVVKIWGKQEDYISTRGFEGMSSNPLTFLDVVSAGLAPDRGLFVPKGEFPKFSLGQLERLVHLPYEERCLRILEQLPIGTLSPRDLRLILHQAYSTFNHPEVLPTVHLNNDVYLMETFHGPTASFKDLALQVVPKFMRHLKSTNSERLGLLVATSGDTGTAALDGFGREKDFPVVVLYPEHGVSMVQERQMRTANPESLVIGVDSDFDFCQTAVKDIFEDSDFNRELLQTANIRLTAANSINWGRLFPQIVFAFSSYLDLIKKKKISLGDSIDVAVPTGNFGNILGVFYAKQMGIPIENITSVSNENNILHDFLSTGIYNLGNRQIQPTISPSVDILVSSNLERFLYHLSGRDTELIRSLFSSLEKNRCFEIPHQLKEACKSEIQGQWTSEASCRSAIAETLKSSGILIDPHTALAVAASSQTRRDRPLVISSTAHFAKFPDAILASLGVPLSGGDDLDSIARMYEQLQLLPSRSSVHPELVKVSKRPMMQNNRSPANIKNIKNLILEFFRK